MNEINRVLLVIGFSCRVMHTNWYIYIVACIDGFFAPFSSAPDSRMEPATKSDFIYRDIRMRVSYESIFVVFLIIYNLHPRGLPRLSCPPKSSSFYFLLLPYNMIPGYLIFASYVTPNLRALSCLAYPVKYYAYCTRVVPVFYATRVLYPYYPGTRVVYALDLCI